MDMTNFPTCKRMLHLSAAGHHLHHQVLQRFLYQKNKMNNTLNENGNGLNCNGSVTNIALQLQQRECISTTALEVQIKQVVK